jgi:signal transduction histidine kinase
MAPAVQLADYVEANKHRVIERWEALALERLSLVLERSELIDHLPEFLDDLVAAARDPLQHWPDLESARNHGRQRMRAGVDLGGLTMEMALVAEALLTLADDDGETLSCSDMRLLSRVIGQGTAASVNEYIAMRDQQLAKQAAQHFSFIAHEIRSPLHSAKLASWMLSMCSDADRQQYLGRLDRALTQLTELVDNSLVQARLYGEPNLNVEQHDVLELLEAARADVAAHAEARNMTMTVEAQRFVIEGDRKLLVSALTNLLQNAVKFTPEGGCVRLCARPIEDRALFEVDDQCGGMAEGVPDRLFQPFVQASADKSGFGLGLAIVKQAVSAHHGAVRVANRPGQGCTFVLDLPLRQPDSSE